MQTIKVYLAFFMNFKIQITCSLFNPTLLTPPGERQVSTKDEFTKQTAFSISIVYLLCFGFCFNSISCMLSKCIFNPVFDFICQFRVIQEDLLN